MISTFKTIVIAAVMAVTCLSQTQQAEAGPLLDWLRGVRRPCCGQTVAPFTAARPVTPNVGNLQPGQCMKTCNKTCSRTVVNYVPYTAYRTNWNKVPVTKYRPVTSSDPCTGCTMTCMKPCTTYTYQMQRVPYTTYRPVYRQEQYTVPVTTITNDCSTGTCGTCSTGTCDTCATGASSAAPQNYAPTPTYATPTFSSPSQGGSLPAADIAPSITLPGGSTSRLPIPTGTLNTGGSFQAQSVQAPPAQYTPAQYTPTPHTASAPDIRTATQGVRPATRQRSFLDRLENKGSNADRSDRYTTQADRRNDIRPKTEMQSLRRRWSYSPVRMASNKTSSAPTRFTSVSQPTKVDRQRINDAWEDVR